MTSAPAPKTEMIPMGGEFLAALIIVAVLAGGTKPGRAFIREARRATRRRAPRAAMQHHSGRLGAATGHAIAGSSLRVRRSSTRMARSAATGLWQTRRGPLIPLIWRADPDHAEGSAGSAAPAPEGIEPTDHPVHGDGPWLMRFRSRSGRVIDGLGNGGRGSSECVIGVYDPADLTRRLALTDAAPDIEAQVRPMPKPDDDTDPGWPAWDDAPATAPRHCVACGNPEGGQYGPLAIYDEPVFASGNHPRLIHESHFTDESSGFYGRPRKPAPGPDDPGPGTGPAPAAPTPGTPSGTGHRRTNMTARYILNLEPPTTDGEFLESCMQLGDVLKSLAEQIGNWADGLGSLKLPQSVLNPLHQVSDGITDAASGASQAAKSFEDEFEDARDTAAAGMHFTGQDAA